MGTVVRGGLAFGLDFAAQSSQLCDVHSKERLWISVGLPEGDAACLVD